MSTHNMFFWKTGENYPRIITKYSSLTSPLIIIIFAPKHTLDGALALPLSEEMRVSARKTYNKTCVTSKDSDQVIHPLSMARGLVYPSLDSRETEEGSWDQQRLWSDYADVQADLSLLWSHKSYWGFVVLWLI